VQWIRLLSIAVVLIICPCLRVGFAADWKQFRGSDGTGVARSEVIPTAWSDNEQIAWKVALPGRGPSSPIVVDGRVIVTCSDGARQDKILVACFDTASGKQLWRRQFWATGRTLSHPDSANAAPTPASDGSRIFAFYSSNDLACLDLAGNLLWYRGLAHDYPKAGNDVGMSASPVVVGETVVVQVENYADSFAAGIDTATGETRWRIDRPAISNWCSPAAMRSPGGELVVLLQSPSMLTAHDPRTGARLWQYETKCESIPSVVASGKHVVLPANGLTVLELEGSAPKVLWDSNRMRSGSSSPITDGENIYLLNSAGVLTCARLISGEVAWQTRIGGTFWATPVIAGEHLLCVNQEGKAKIVKLGGSKAEIVGEADFGEKIQGTPAIADGAIFVRSDRHLWKIGTKRK